MISSNDGWIRINNQVHIDCGSVGYVQVKIGSDQFCADSLEGLCQVVVVMHLCGCIDLLYFWLTRLPKTLGLSLNCVYGELVSLVTLGHFSIWAPVSSH